MEENVLYTHTYIHTCMYMVYVANKSYVQEIYYTRAYGTVLIRSNVGFDKVIAKVL